MREEAFCPSPENRDADCETTERSRRWAPRQWGVTQLTLQLSDPFYFGVWDEDHRELGPLANCPFAVYESNKLSKSKSSSLYLLGQVTQAFVLASASSVWA